MARKRNKLGLDIVGVTPEGKNVVSGVFRVFDTCGLPLDVVFDLCDENNFIPSWTHFYEDAIKQGWTAKTIFNRLSSTIPDSYGKQVWLDIKKRLEMYIKSVN